MESKKITFKEAEFQFLQGQLDGLCTREICHWSKADKVYRKIMAAKIAETRRRQRCDFGFWRGFWKLAYSVRDCWFLEGDKIRESKYRNLENEFIQAVDTVKGGLENGD